MNLLPSSRRKRYIPNHAKVISRGEMKYFFEHEIVIERLKRTGPGGQHRNKRETGVRITHLPTGIKVEASERRSQHQNLEAALERLNQRLRKRLERKKPRKKTNPTNASRERRLTEKKLHARKKEDRRPRFDD